MAWGEALGRASDKKNVEIVPPLSVHVHGVTFNKLNTWTNVCLTLFSKYLNITVPSLHRYSISVPQPRCQQWQEGLLERPGH
jgi:hypothetical protein